MNALRITAALRWCISPSHVQVASAVAMNSPVGEGRLCGHEDLREHLREPGLVVIDITAADQASATEATVALGGLWFSSGVSAPLAHPRRPGRRHCPRLRRPAPPAPNGALPVKDKMSTATAAGSPIPTTPGAHAAGGHRVSVRRQET
ncbi:DUF6207 family protein [Streptomyces caniferus]|uniref:DUF6207 family protein n=1 Tax=Streptomyces caniferus TaxID=285557 RepID=UPI002E29C1A2|nr:DUF6207 family protein [Streptomyces caniferus]